MAGDKESGADRRYSRKAEHDPEPKTPTQEADTEGNEKPVGEAESEGGGTEKSPVDGQREERMAMYKRHRNEHRDMHGEHRTARDNMASRHEDEIAEMMKRHEAMMGAGDSAAGDEA